MSLRVVDASVAIKGVLSEDGNPFGSALNY